MVVNLRKLDLNLLVVFDAIYAERHITQAGHRVGLSQPAVSNALRRLRDVLEDELFTRGPDGLLPTARAQELAGPVHQILEELSQVLDQRPFDPATAQGVISIATVDLFEALIVPELAVALAERAPGLNLRLVPTSGQSYEMLDRGEVDLAVASFGALPKRFEKQICAVADYGCIMREGHPLAQKPMTAEGYAGARHVLLNPRGDMRGWADDALEARGMQRQVCLTVTNFMSARQTLLETDAIMTAPQPMVDHMAKEAGLVACDCPLVAPDAYRSLEVIWHKRLFSHPLGAWVVELIGDVSDHVFGTDDQR